MGQLTNQTRCQSMQSQPSVEEFDFEQWQRQVRPRLLSALSERRRPMKQSTDLSKPFQRSKGKRSSTRHSIN
jgi:hypothetical protein